MVPAGVSTFGGLTQDDVAGLREQIRRLVIEELSALAGGTGG
jgi:hypothetical protein